MNNAKHELERYMFYYERYIQHHKSMEAADKHLSEVAGKVLLLHQVKNYTDGELKFLMESCHEVIKCRSVLKWSYVYGYYAIPKMSKIQ